MRCSFPVCGHKKMSYYFSKTVAHLWVLFDFYDYMIYYLFVAAVKTLILWDFFEYRYHTSLFQRPGVTELLNRARSGGVQCIIVKDFSRFGRNYIEVGDYIEVI